MKLTKYFAIILSITIFKGVNSMIKYARNLNRLDSPSKMADDAVFALSSIERGREVSLEFLKEGVELCDYIINLIEEIKAPETKKNKLTFRAVHDDKEVLHEIGIDIDEVQKIKSLINDLIKDVSSHTSEEVESIQKFLITTTMPMWKNRTLELREKKMKRGLIIRG